MLNYVELLLFPGVDEVLNKMDARGYTPLIIGAQVEKSRESENFSGWGGVTPHSEIIVGDEPLCIFEPPCCRKGGSHPILKS